MNRSTNICKFFAVMIEKGTRRAQRTTEGMEFDSVISVGLRYLRVPFFLSMMMIFFSCTSHQHNDKSIFRYNESSGIASLDPAFAKNKMAMWMVHQLYNTLVQNDSNLQMAPCLAKRWDISADNLTFTFYLRDDVHFTDDACFPNGKGRSVNAHDVEYSFKRIIDKSPNKQAS